METREICRRFKICIIDSVPIELAGVKNEKSIDLFAFRVTVPFTFASPS